MAKHYTANMYVTGDGRMITARDTDQSHSRDLNQRTWLGTPVEYCGDSYQVKRKYQAAKIAVAQERAASREAVMLRGRLDEIASLIGFIDGTPVEAMVDFCKEKGWEDLAADILGTARGSRIAHESAIGILRCKSEDLALLAK